MSKKLAALAMAAVSTVAVVIAALLSLGSGHETLLAPASALAR